MLSNAEDALCLKSKCRSTCSIIPKMHFGVSQNVEVTFSALKNKNNDTKLTKWNRINIQIFENIVI